QGQLSVNTVSATVAITNVQGPCHANTVSGDIATTTINGPFHGNTVSGNAILADSAVALNWNTVSGDLIVRTSEVSSLQANSVSGSVTAELPAPPSDGVSMQSVSGDLTLVVPATFNCVAQLTSMNGRAHVDLPATVLEERRGRWQARINGGGPSVRLSTMSGSLRIHRNDGVVAGEFASGTVSGSPSSQRDEELRILRQIERREISIDEGLARLEELRRARAQEGEQHVSG
ncbi:MAG: DUF4097 domain-containing protein, partial [Chloroflexi bacterium]|nr:DUF4097 domain-containing protein [Chloroflexota bacterium]